MTLSTIIKLFIAALVALLIAFSPAEALANVDLNEAGACSIDHKNDTPSDSDPAEQGHHFHHCSACHVHVDRRDEMEELVPAYSEQKYWALSSTSICRAPPYGLFRPPRV